MRVIVPGIPVLFAALALANGAARSSPVQPAVRFEVASIRPNKMPLGPGNMPSLQPVGNGLAATNMALLDLISFAYSVSPVHLINVPQWAESERFDIDARGDGTATLEINKGRMRALLEDRFQLKVHTESRRLPSYSLKVIRESQLGPGLRAAPAEATCEAAARPPSASGATKTEPPCVVKPTRNGFAGQALTLAQVARYVGVLGAQFGGLENTNIADATGLTGRFSVTFDYTSQDAAAARAEANPGDAAPVDPGAIVDAFRRALEDQLGLRLVTEMRPTDVLIVDQVSRLPEN